ncbi:hypothetical protein ACHAXS_012979 [Conticribra weissflogii]
MPSPRSLLLPLLATSASAFLSAPGRIQPSVAIPRVSITQPLQMALDYNDPAVAEEFAKVQGMEYDDVVAELAQSGVRAPVTMGDMEVKLMLVELRMLGSSASKKQKKRPDKFSSKFEEALWTKPVFAAMYEDLKAKGDHNSMNVVAEYINEGADAKARYYSSYGALIDQAEAALNAKPEVTSPKVKFSGFPSNMGEAGLQMTLQALGEVVEFSCAMSDDFPVLVGEVTFADVESAKKAIDQYDGMDMGMGEKLQMVSV